MDSWKQKGVAASSQPETEVATLREQLGTKEALIQLKDARILELLGAIQAKNTEIKSKDEEIKALKEKLKEKVQKSSANKNPSRRGATKKRPPATTANSQASDKDKSSGTQTKPSSTTPTIETSPTSPGRLQENRASNAGPPRDDDLDDLPPASILDDEDNDPSLDGSPGPKNLEPKPSEDATGEMPKKKAPPKKKRAHAQATGDTTETAAKKPPRKKKKQSGDDDKNVSAENPQRPWEELYEELAEFKRKFGLKRAPSKEEYPDLTRFYQFHRNKYNLYKRGDVATDLTPEQIEKLEAIGFADNHRTPGEKGWEMRFQELKAFKEQHGHFRVSRHENSQLWGWIKVRHTVETRKSHETTLDVVEQF